MVPKNLRIFLDTSVVFAAVLSPIGGARKLFLLAEAGIIRPVVGPTVLKECDEVIRRKAPGSLPTLAQLLAAAQMETSAAPQGVRLKRLRRMYATYLMQAYWPKPSVPNRIGS